MSQTDQEWQDLRQRLERVVRMRGVDAVAEEIPADPKTVYRLVHGKVARPTLAVREGVRNVVEAREARTRDW